MAEPITTSTAAFFSVTKVWSILAGVCGSIIPVMALSEKHKLSLRNAFFMALTGSSFAIFVGPLIADYFKISAVEAIAGLSWALGVIGVYVVRAVLNWLDQRGVVAIDMMLSKVVGLKPELEGGEGEATPDDKRVKERILIEKFDTDSDKNDSNFSV
jgi:hypothetical protein